MDAAAFLRAHCFKCHSEKKKSGGVRLDDLPADPARDVERWLAVRDQIRDGLMPPAKEPRPDAAQVRGLVNWLTVQSGARPSGLPNQGNLIPHELLFAKTADSGAEASPSRLWRLSPDGYLGLIHELLKGKAGAKGAKGQAPAGIIQPFNLVLVEHVYGFEKWPSPQPVAMPKSTRIGILMQPSWLVAWGTNFDNDPVRRGRWIRERLLGGTVPDLPIGVAAQMPDDPHRTLRDRLKVTREPQCWKCHRRMDDLGYPFEQFDLFGRFRTTEDVQDTTQPPKKNPKGKAIGVAGVKSLPLDTSGLIADSGDSRLDGSVKDPREMIRKIADSDRARQVFVRHVFRYFMGRDETLSDARTLQEADRVYIASGGSFKALVHSLLTSDVFLYRRANIVASK